MMKHYDEHKKELLQVIHRNGIISQRNPMVRSDSGIDTHMYGYIYVYWEKQITI